MLPAVVRTRRRRSRGGCCLTSLIVLVLLLIGLGAGWLFVLRPYAHNIAQTELDNAMQSAVNQIPPETKQLPPNSTLPVTENAINNLIVLNLAPSNPVQHPATHITGNDIRLDFQLYGFPCAATVVPQVQNGRLIVNHTTVEGIVGLVMSPDEITTLLNKHLSDAQNKLQRSITGMQLKAHEVDLTLG